MRLALTEKGRSCIQSIKDVTDKMEEILLKRNERRRKNIVSQAFSSCKQ